LFLSFYSVSASFSQGAIFYAGETISCTISFTHSLQQQNTTSLVNNAHTRAHSFSSSFDLNNGKIQQSNGILNNNRHEVESLALASAPSRKMSLSSLASSTFSFITGSTSVTKESITEEWKGNNKQKCIR
jgi:hypothetical protein